MESYNDMISGLNSDVASLIINRLPRDYRTVSRDFRDVYDRAENLEINRFARELIDILKFHRFIDTEALVVEVARQLKRSLLMASRVVTYLQEWPDTTVDDSLTDVLASTDDSPWRSILAAIFGVPDLSVLNNGRGGDGGVYGLYYFLTTLKYPGGLANDIVVLYVDWVRRNAGIRQLE